MELNINVSAPKISPHVKGKLEINTVWENCHDIAREQKAIREGGHERSSRNATRAQKIDDDPIKPWKNPPVYMIPEIKSSNTSLL